MTSTPQSIVPTGPESAVENLFHVGVLSNFARGYEHYSRSYSKQAIAESRYPGEFYLLRRDELHIGIEKARRLLARLDLPGNRMLVLETSVPGARLHANTRTGLGRYLESDRITLKSVYQFDAAGGLQRIEFEDALAHSLALHEAGFVPYPLIRPRSISFLPVARACQARCAFCFSKASISHDQGQAPLDWPRIEAWLDRARRHGAERAVITGGGEPTLLAPADLLRLVSLCRRSFDKVVLISNAHVLATRAPPERVRALAALSDAGLAVLAISRHHFDDASNTRLMGLSTPVEALAQSWRGLHPHGAGLALRLICVLQKGGIDCATALAGYLDWAVRLGVREICFKELYVSTRSESLYHDRQSNTWCRAHQVPLSLVTMFLHQQGFEVASRLPWGAPILAGCWKGQPLRVAAYTEPSLFWERTQGQARSWNVLSDGRNYVSLEDRASELSMESVR